MTPPGRSEVLTGVGGVGDWRSIGNRKLPRRPRDADADAGRDVPTSEAILEFMGDVGRAVDVAAIAQHFGLRPKQVVALIDALCERGLVVSCGPGPIRSGRGKARYVAGIGDADTPETQDAYLGLSELLIAVLVGGRNPYELGRQAGRMIGKAMASSDSSEPSDAVAQLEVFLASRGFRPEQIGTRPDIAFVLGCCPFEKAALTNPSLVCGLHRALAEGMAEALGGAFEVTNLVARDPRTAGCRLELHTIDQPD